MTLFLSFLDQIRASAGTLVAVHMMCHGILPKRRRFALRAAVCWSVFLMAELLYVPMTGRFGTQFARFPILTAPYWLSMSALSVVFVLCCYQTNLAGALYRLLIAACVENVATVLIRYLFVLSLFPDFPERHPLAYIGFMMVVYAVTYGAAVRFIRPRIRTDEAEMYPNPKTAALVHMVISLGFLQIVSTAKVLCENVILPLETIAETSTIFYYLRFFCIFIMLLTSFTLLMLLLAYYNNIALENEKQIIMQLAQDRQSQYEFSRENIEMINRKCHDLRHQLKALEYLSDDERAAQLRQTRRAIDFYDAVVRTGNEALDTLLTEKSVYCVNRAIRLSCTVASSRLDRIELVDLYTLLGNAIDNAIESADGLDDPAKKVVSLNVGDRGQMLHIQIDNYYSGSLELSDGLPVTTKADRRNHGYGVKSIRAIVQKYAGELMIDMEDHVFSLQILIPT